MPTAPADIPRPGHTGKAKPARHSAAKELVSKLVRMARGYAKTSREYTRSKEYWQGMSRGYLDAARYVAHASYGARWCGARHAVKEGAK